MQLLRFSMAISGLLVVYIGERYLSGDVAGYTRPIGSLLSFLGVALSWLAVQRSNTENEAKVWKFATLWPLMTFAGVLLYIFYSKNMGPRVAPETFIEYIWLVSWVISIGLGLFLAIGVEWAIYFGGSGDFAEPDRVKKSGISWMCIGMLLVLLSSINFGVVKKDIVADWSYLKTTQPSDSTLAMLNGLEKPIEVAIFLSRGSEVRPQLRSYFDILEANTKNVEVNYYDKDINPVMAENFKVTAHGSIVMTADDKKARLRVGDTLEKARKKLAKLDQEFQSKLREISAEQKTILFMRGHGEMHWTGDRNQGLRSIKELERYLGQQKYEVKTFDIASGSGSAIPEYTDVVVIAGSTRAFQQAEVDVLKQFLDRGGAVIVLFDIDKDKSDDTISSNSNPLSIFLAEVGIRFDATPLANEEKHVVATRSPADKWFIMSNIFTSHESVASLSRHEERVALLAFQSGSLDVSKSTAGWRVNETVRTFTETFRDLNRNYQFDANSKEAKKAYVIGAAAEKNVEHEGREVLAKIIAFSDATAISDPLIRNPANLVFFMDSLRWLTGEADVSGIPMSEEDVKIQHNRDEDIMWFNITVVAMPLLVLLVGFLATRRKRRLRIPVAMEVSANA